MEETLREINATFQSGKHKQAIDELQTLIDTSAPDAQLYKVHDLLADCLNFVGEHSEAIQAWTTALKLLEDNSGDVDQLNEGQLIDWINISIGMARVMHRQGREGSGVSHKSTSVCYTASKFGESEEVEWKRERIETAIKHYKKAIDRIPDSLFETKTKIRTELAQALFNAGDCDEAVKIYEDAFNTDGNAEWLYKAADCSWQQGNKEQAYVRLQQLIGTDPTFAKAYEMCATYFTEKDDAALAKEYTSQYNFYSWVPSFCHHIEYNPENVSLLRIIQSDKALKCIETTLTMDTSKRSTEFLASICYHHYHGRVENKAFEVLEQRGTTLEGEERDFIGDLLMYLLKNHRSICTIKGAANALAGMKHDQLFEILANLLPQDIDLFYPMHIPNALAKLGDQRAIPFLINIIEKPVAIENCDSDSSDGFLSSGGTGRLVVESCLALSPFFDDEKVKEVLLSGINKEQIREACLAVLSVHTEEKQYLDELEKILTDGDTLDYRVIAYLLGYADKSEQVYELLKMNAEVHKKKDVEINAVSD